MQAQDREAIPHLPLYAPLVPVVAAGAAVSVAMASGAPENLLAVSTLFGGAVGSASAGGLLSAGLLFAASVSAVVILRMELEAFDNSGVLAAVVAAVLLGGASGAIGAFADAVAAAISDGKEAGGSAFAADVPSEEASLLRHKLSTVRSDNIPAVPKSSKVPETSFADVVVVGAGTAGASLAARLARDGRKVAVIESNLELQVRACARVCARCFVDLLHLRIPGSSCPAFTRLPAYPMVV